MTLSRLLSVLQHVQGNGHPAVFRTPDGKEWEASSVLNEMKITETTDKIKTTIHLKEVKPS